MIVVAGHVCLDLIPKIGHTTDLAPGSLVDVGPMTFSPGGTVSNVGIALSKLGSQVRAVGKVGKDDLGLIVHRIFHSHQLDLHLVSTSEAATSYSVVISRPGFDRVFLHHSGANDVFVSNDLSDEAFEGAKHVHFGYPPLMRRIRENRGEELKDIFDRAKRAGLSTSLDMSLPDPNSEQGRVDWRQFLKNVLPSVDFFVPSEDELAFMLGHEDMAERALNLGAACVVLKQGERGVKAVTGTEARMAQIAGLMTPQDWAGKVVEQPCFPVKAVDTTGSGDATIAGFLFGFTRGFSLGDSLRAGCAVGATCVEGIGATSNIPNWDSVASRFLR